MSSTRQLKLQPQKGVGLFDDTGTGALDDAGHFSIPVEVGAGATVTLTGTISGLFVDGAYAYSDLTGTIGDSNGTLSGTRDAG